MTKSQKLYINKRHCMCHFDIIVAFSEYHGYGFRFYDYLPPPTNATPVEEQELLSGMFSLRSFLLPRVYMLMFSAADFLSLQLLPLTV